MIVQLSDTVYSYVWLSLPGYSPRFMHVYCSFLHELQKRIASRSSNCMRIDHSTYRDYLTDKRQERWQGFIDGDLVETLVDMPREDVSRIVEDMHMPRQLGQHPTGQEFGYDEEAAGAHSSQSRVASAESVLKIVEELARFH